MAIITTEVKSGLFLQQWTEFNVKKVVVKILQGSVVTQTMLGGLTIYPRIANFLQCIMCQKLWKLVGTRQSYCQNKQACFFGPPFMYADHTLPSWSLSIMMEIQIRNLFL